MRISYTPQFRKSFFSLPHEQKKKFKKQAEFLLNNLQHPSLHAKKYDEARGIWQARVDRHYRFYFVIERDTFVLLDVIPHPK